MRVLARGQCVHESTVLECSGLSVSPGMRYARHHKDFFVNSGFNNNNNNMEIVHI